MGMQRYGLYAAITEGVSNLFLSVAGMIFFGAPGVAWGTFVAAVIGLAMQVLQVMRWAVEIPINRRAFLRAGIFQPVLAFLPLVIWVACHSWYVSRFQPSWLETEVPLLACILFTGWLIFAGMRHQDRDVLEPAG
jgi:drug/metabolite transporter (DMT)-like permease